MHRFLTSIALLGLLALPYTLEARSAAPLCCGAASVMVKGGTAPAHYTHLGPNYVVVPTLTPPVFTNDAARFDDQFHVPWTVGAELGLNASCHFQVFLEYAYTQARRRLFGSDDTVGEHFSNFRSHAGYLGVRYYLCKLGCVTPYLGLKTGLVWQERVMIDLVINNFFVFSNPYSLSQVAISGALQAGGEWQFCCHWSLVLQGEFDIAQAPRANPNLVFPPLGGGGPSNVQVGQAKWLISYPITLGLRFRF